jgi:hypothetical protein
MLQSYLCEAQNGFLPIVKEMHLSFESLTITGTLGLYTSLMDIHHDVSFKFILEDDSISLTSRVHIHFCSSKGVRLWLVVRPSFCLFCIAHFIFTSMLCFHPGLIQPLAFSFTMCECEHRLEASGTHLSCYLFGC